MTTRRSLLGIAVVFFVNGIGFGSWLPRLPELRDRLDLDLSTIGLVLATNGIGGLVGSALSGYLVGKLGARRTAVWPALLLAISLPWIGVVPHATFLAAIIAFAAAADAAADVGMNALAVRAQNVRGRSIFTRLHALWSLGSLAGAGAATLAAAGGLRLFVHLLLVAGISVAAIAWAATTLPATAAEPRSRPRVSLALGVGLLGGAVALVEGIPHDWSAIFLADVLAADPAVAGTGFISLSAGMVAGRLAGDRVVDRLGTLRSIYGGLTIVAVAMAAFILSPGVLVAIIALAGWGLGVAVIFPLLYRLAGSHGDFAEGTGLAALGVGSRVGFMAGPAAVGTIAAATTLPVGIGIVVGSALLVTVLMVVRSLTD